jgi:PAS domain S-box-containing protein
LTEDPTRRTDADAGQAGRLRQAAEQAILGRARRTTPDRRATSSQDLQGVLHDLQVHQIELEMQNDELRRTQDALEAARARYFDLYDLAPVGYFTLSERGLILEANLTGAGLLGMPRGALPQTPFGHFVAHEDADHYYLHHRKLFKTGQPQAFELRLSRHDGASITAWLDATVAAGDDGSPVCRLTVTDVSDRKRIQDQLRQSLSLLQVAGKMAQVGGWTIQLPSYALHWSDEICTLLDYPHDTAVPLPEALSRHAREPHEAIYAALKACAQDGTPIDCELEALTAGRRAITVRVIGQAVRDGAGQVTRIEGALQDITEGKRALQAQASLEAQLRESQKMEAIGTLAAGIAHDFNNILGTILGNAELARQDSGRNYQALVSLEEIRKAGHRAQDLVEQILSFSRRQPTWRRIVSLQPLVEESVRLMCAGLPGGVRLTCHCNADAPAVAANPTLVKQVLLNLGANAAHAMQGRPGNIDVRVEKYTQDAGSDRPGLNLRPGHYARIVFSDTGHGMDAAVQRRIFEPFFTTKPTGEGTGLGLAVVHGIMQTHEGAISVHSEPGKGSRFELYFPTANTATQPLDPGEDAGPGSEGYGQHILYIDDDESQMYLVKRMVERWGYQVSTYREQNEAIDAVKSGDIRFDLVITDFKMPGISGLEVACAMRDARPDLPVLMVSGYINNQLRAQAAAAGVRELFAKPLEVEDLRDAVQRLLAPPGRDPLR